MSSKRVLVTGASGFVGRGLCERLCRDGIPATAAIRQVARRKPCATTREVTVPSLGPNTDWRAALNNVDRVVHLAARAHVMKEDNADPNLVYRKTNTDGTLSLARQAAAAGVRRFIFISSIKVNAEGTRPSHPFRADDPPAPQDPYAVSKWEAERGLLELAAQSDMELVIIRPPLVYGPGVKGNFAAMMRWVARGVPLPLGRVRNNRRSLVGLDNLVDLLVTCLDHPAAANEIFLVSDGDDLSTTALLRRLGCAMDKPARLLPVPVWLLRSSAMMLGKQAVAQRLFGSLQVDTSKTRELLGWMPPVTVDEGLRRTVEGFRTSDGV